ncbi:YunG family protein [Nocardia grenadensis]|uniref:YunG family protein n=1 Tax=Nocardia grenadensis TaxID=931537 RepID=UPI003D926802
MCCLPWAAGESRRSCVWVDPKSRSGPNLRRTAGRDGNVSSLYGYRHPGRSQRCDRSSWSAETSSAPAERTGSPAKGQCAVTACVVHDYLGGGILHTVATLPSGETVSHYLNHIDGQTVDLTAQQFPPGTGFTSPIPKTRGMPSTREYCLSYDGTRRRYELLSARVAESLRIARRS